MLLLRYVWLQLFFGFFFFRSCVSESTRKSVTLGEFTVSLQPFEDDLTDNEKKQIQNSLEHLLGDYFMEYSSWPSKNTTVVGVEIPHVIDEQLSGDTVNILMDGIVYFDEYSEVLPDSALLDSLLLEALTTETLTEEMKHLFPFLVDATVVPLHLESSGQDNTNSTVNNDDNSSGGDVMSFTFLRVSIVVIGIVVAIFGLLLLKRYCRRFYSTSAKHDEGNFKKNKDTLKDTYNGLDKTTKKKKKSKSSKEEGHHRSSSKHKKKKTDDQSDDDVNEKKKRSKSKRRHHSSSKYRNLKDGEITDDEEKKKRSKSSKRRKHRSSSRHRRKIDGENADADVKKRSKSSSRHRHSSSSKHRKTMDGVSSDFETTIPPNAAKCKHSSCSSRDNAVTSTKSSSKRNSPTMNKDHKDVETGGGSSPILNSKSYLQQISNHSLEKSSKHDDETTQSETTVPIQKRSTLDCPSSTEALVSANGSSSVKLAEQESKNVVPESQSHTSLFGLISTGLSASLSRTLSTSLDVVKEEETNVANTGSANAFAPTSFFSFFTSGWNKERQNAAPCEAPCEVPCTAPCPAPNKEESKIGKHSPISDEVEGSVGSIDDDGESIDSMSESSEGSYSSSEYCMAEDDSMDSDGSESVASHGAISGRSSGELEEVSSNTDPKDGNKKGESKPARQEAASNTSTDGRSEPGTLRKDGENSKCSEKSAKSDDGESFGSIQQLSTNRIKYKFLENKSYVSDVMTKISLTSSNCDDSTQGGSIIYTIDVETGNGEDDSLVEDVTANLPNPLATGPDGEKILYGASLAQRQPSMMAMVGNFFDAKW